MAEPVIAWDQGFEEPAALDPENSTLPSHFKEGSMVISPKAAVCLIRAPLEIAPCFLRVTLSDYLPADFIHMTFEYGLLLPQILSRSLRNKPINFYLT